MHATTEELESLQRQEIAAAIAENRIGVSADKAIALGQWTRGTRGTQPRVRTDCGNAMQRWVGYFHLHD